MADNAADFTGGLYEAAGALTTGNSLVSANTQTTASSSYGSDLTVLSNGFTDQGNNLWGYLVGATANGTDIINASPPLGPLQNNGGPTETMVPIAGFYGQANTAVDNGSDTLAANLTTDQRGYPRIVGGFVDIGAAELQDDMGLSGKLVAVPSATFTTYTDALVVTNSGPDAATLPIIADPLPQGATYSSTFIQQQPTLGWTYAYANGTLTMSGPSLASGAFLIYFVTYTIPNSITTINHTVNIVHPNFEDPNTGNNTLTLTYARVPEGSQPTAGTVLYQFNDNNRPPADSFTAVVDWGDGTTDTSIAPESLFEGEGNANDTIGNNFNATIHGGVAYGPGQVGQAFQFDGQVGSYFENPYINNPQAALNSATATWSFWINTTAVPTGNGMGLMGMMDANQQNGLALSMNSSGQLVANFASNGTMASLTGTTAINDGGWHQIAVTFQGSASNPVQVNIYVNGALQQSGTVAVTGLTSLPETVLRLGSLLGTYWAPYLGSLDEVAVYEKVLLPEQVAMLPQGNNVMVVTDPVSGYDVIGTHTYQEAGYYDATMTVNDPTSVDAYGNPSTSSSISSVTGLVHLYNGNGNTTDMGGGPPAVIIGTAVSPGYPTGGLPAFVFTGADNTSSLALAPLDFNQSDFSLDFSIYTTSTDQETIFSNSPPGGNGLSGNTFSLRMGDTTPGILTLSLHRRQAACQQRRIPLRKQSLPCHGRLGQKAIDTVVVQQFAGDQAWRAAGAISWWSANQEQKKDLAVQALDLVLARYGV